MKTYEELIKELDDNQREASRIDTNAVIAAGAGSGKTRVLAARFVYLNIEKEIPVDEILALTFTKKAASEMYTRIYATLCEIDHPLAREAVSSFHLARIDTIDAFCNSVARNACRQYGISPDFTIDNDEALSLASDLALPFFLEHRTSEAIRQFMKKYSLAELSPSLFADTVVRYSPVSKPLDFERFRAIQKNEISTRFPRAAEEIIRSMHTLARLPPAKGKTWEQVALALEEIPGMIEIDDKTAIATFIASCDKLERIALPGKVADQTLVELKEILSDFKKKQYPEFLSLANYVLNDTFVEETFRLLGEFQNLFHKKKREAGIMTFADISQMALDALIADPVLRSAYKDSTRAIMIDEFQDNNMLQRNLFFLIAEKKERRDLSVPDSEELCPDKLFFVGDEKQSIYRFRGADVSVFRELTRDLSSSKNPELGTNYRTEAPLISIFNHIFPFIFLNPLFYSATDFPLYEASFAPINASRNTADIESALDVLLINEDNFTSANAGELGETDTEAAEVASRIRALVDSGYEVRGENGKRPCTWSDIAILFRSGTKQHFFEKHLRENAIPYQAESLRGLFNDAPINDLYALLRLAVYPADNTAYAMLLRSPFVTLGDKGFAIAVLHRTASGMGTSTMPPPFSPEVDSLLDREDRSRFIQGRELYLRITEMADRMSASSVITELWYTEGYRYAVLSNPDLHRYAELYDYFFELARQADRKGETLATFLDRIASLMASGDKINDLDIPVERSGGVKLLTVHKSKGLEFPIVFLVDCGNNGNADRNSAPVYFSETTGISVNTGAAEDAENARTNYFYEKGREEEKSKAQAEIRRLLYVAMTRAETRLCISGTIKLDAEKSTEARNEDNIRSMLLAWLDKKDERAAKEGKHVPKRSFFDFLLPSLIQGKVKGISITEIMPSFHTNENAKKGKEENDAEKVNSIESAPLYDKASAEVYESAQRTRYSATALHELSLSGTKDSVLAEDTGTVQDALDILLKHTHTLATDFGTFAHRSIEARFTGFYPFMPEELRPTTEAMADRFIASDLGKKTTEATWRENEYGFITRYIFEGKELTITGQIDLIFEYGDTVYIVDYKTDKVENPAVHAQQMDVYRKAAFDLRGKKVETWLFYLRSAHAVLLE